MIDPKTGMYDTSRCRFSIYYQNPDSIYNTCFEASCESEAEFFCKMGSRVEVAMWTGQYFELIGHIEESR